MPRHFPRGQLKLDGLKPSSFRGCPREFRLGPCSKHSWAMASIDDGNVQSARLDAQNGGPRVKQEPCQVISIQLPTKLQRTWRLKAVKFGQKAEIIWFDRFVQTRPPDFLDRWLQWMTEAVQSAQIGSWAEEWLFCRAYPGQIALIIFPPSAIRTSTKQCGGAGPSNCARKRPRDVFL